MPVQVASSPGQKISGDKVAVLQGEGIKNENFTFRAIRGKYKHCMGSFEIFVRSSSWKRFFFKNYLIIIKKTYLTVY